MADSDSEKEVVPENIPPHKIRFCDIDMKLVKEVVKCMNKFYYLLNYAKLIFYDNIA